MSLLGAAKALRDSVGSVIDPGDQPEHDRHLAAMRAQLGEAAFDKAWVKGQGMTFEEAVGYATKGSVVQAPQPEASQPTKIRDCDDLTPRECEVAALIAQSKSNAEIAEAMVVSKRTVETHVTNILSKLRFSSRGQVAAWAIKKGLAPSAR